MFRIAPVLLFVAAMMVAAGCGGEEVAEVGGAATAGESATPPSVTATVTAVPATATVTSQSTAACQVPQDNLGKTVVRTLSSGGGLREYRLHLPPKADDARNGPVVLNFHGLGSNMTEQEVYSGLAPIADREGFVLVTPNGTGSGASRSWAAFENLPGANDVQFVRDLLDALEDSFCIDTSATYSTGMSNGAFMSSRLGCVLSDRITAIAPVAGVYFPTTSCGKRMPVLAFHGTADAVVPFAGGNIFGILPYAGAERGVFGWAQFDGCAPNPGKEDQLADDVRLVSYGGCGGGADAQLVIVTDGGHTWPGAIDVPSLGRTTKSVSAAEMIWDFFKAHPPSD